MYISYITAVGGAQAVLRTFQGIMKEAKRRETASLPRPPPEAKAAATPSLQTSQPDVEAADNRLVQQQQEQAQVRAKRASILMYVCMCVC
jgi:hypothetical protein